MEGFQIATHLVDAFDPVSLPAGLYITRSNSPAYTILYAMQLFGDAELVGDRCFEDGTKVITVLVGHMPRVRANAKGAVTIGPEYLSAALKDYSDWDEKWWREVIQNSYDAGAKNIECEAVRQGEAWQISCSDDGAGMDEDTVINKFLVLGATTKPGGGATAGGFGKAKELILLPWLQWQVYSGDLRVDGVGTQWESAKVEYRKGTLIRVVQSEQRHTDDVAALKFIEKCYLPNVRITVNGNPAKGGLKPVKNVLSIPGKAEVYFNPLKETDWRSKLLVRTREGLFMFDDWIDSSVKGIVIVQLTGPSVQLLNANREGFQDKALEQEISKFRSQLAADVKSAVESKQASRKEKFLGRGKFVADPTEVEVNAMAAIGNLFTGGRKDGEVSGEALGRLFLELVSGAEGDPFGMATMEKEVLKGLLDKRFSGQDEVEAAIKLLVWKPDLMVSNQMEDESYKPPRMFYPGTMTPGVLRLLRIWTELCRFVLIQLGSRSPFGVGFLLKVDTLAACHSEGGEYWLLLNPYGAEVINKYLLDVSNEAVIKMLYALAIHECTHITDSTIHNELFTAALTRNMAVCVGGYSAARKIAKAIKLRGQIEKKPRAEKLPPFDASQLVTFSYYLGEPGSALKVNEQGLIYPPCEDVPKGALVKWLNPLTHELMDEHLAWRVARSHLQVSEWPVRPVAAVSVFATSEVTNVVSIGLSDNVYLAGKKAIDDVVELVIDAVLMHSGVAVDISVWSGTESGKPELYYRGDLAGFWGTKRAL